MSTLSYQPPNAQLSSYTRATYTADTDRHPAWRITAQRQPRDSATSRSCLETRAVGVTLPHPLRDPAVDSASPSAPEPGSLDTLVPDWRIAPSSDRSTTTMDTALTDLR